MISKAPSPLFVWKLLLVVVIVLFLCMALVDPMRFVIPLRKDAFAERLAAVHFEENEIGVLFFGDSLLAAALPANDQRISLKLNQFSRDSYPYQAVNFAVGGVSSQDLNRCREKILALKPRAVILQAEIIFKRFGQPAAAVKSPGPIVRMVQRMDLWARYLRTPILKVLPQSQRADQRRARLFGAMSTPAHVDIGVFKKPEEPQPEVRPPARDLWSNLKLSDQNSYYLFSKDFIEKARAKGVRIIVLETPVSETAAKLAPPGYLKKRSKMIRRLLQPEPDHYIRYPGNWPDENFKDYSHLKPHAQRMYFRWLAPILAKKLAAAE